MAFPAVTDRLRRVREGEDRARVIALLAAVLALESADLATLGAVADQLEQAFGISKAQIGLLASATLVVAALATIPIGMLVDRVSRRRVIVVAVLVWSGSLIAAGAALSYWMLFGTRLLVGAAAAAAFPVVASMTGDFFARRERAGVYGKLLSGEVVGTALGFLLAGLLAAISWRVSFVAMGLLGIPLAWALHRKLPEPTRGGSEEDTLTPSPDGDDPDQDPARRAVREDGAEPPGDLVLHGEVERMPLWRAVRHVLRVRTNVHLILGSAAAYFFLAGVRTFGVVFLREEFGLAQTLATVVLVAIGAAGLIGVLAGGRIADALLARGHVNGRLLVGGGSFLVAAAFFAPGLLLATLAISAPLFALGAGALLAGNPPLDAARLDVIHPRLWGRAEAVRTVLRTTAQAGAPLLFGLVAGLVAAGATEEAMRSVPVEPGREPAQSLPHPGSEPAPGGLRVSFLVMLGPLTLAGVLVLLGMRTYPRDVAAAMASDADDAPAEEHQRATTEDGGGTAAREARDPFEQSDRIQEAPEPRRGRGPP